MRAFLAPCILLCLTLLPLSTQAQFNVDFGGGSFDVDSFANSGFGAAEIGITLSPSQPQPGAEVEASLSDYSSSLYGSSISWVLDGQVIPDAANQRNVTFTAGKAGETQTLQAILTTPEGTTRTLTNTISPVYLDIILEPQTRVPDFYAGRSLPSIGSMINATALVSDGSTIRTTDLIYTWQVGQTVLEGGPLRGGYKVSFEMPRGDQAVLSVRATEPNGTLVANRAVLVRSVMPTVHFYEVSSLFGVKPIVLTDSFTISGNTATVRAEPYHLDSRVFNNPDITEWEINNRSTDTGGNNPYQVTLQKTSSFGNTQLDFHVRDTSEVLQGARSSLRINF